MRILSFLVLAPLVACAPAVIAPSRSTPSYPSSVSVASTASLAAPGDEPTSAYVARPDQLVTTFTLRYLGEEDGLALMKKQVDALTQGLAGVLPEATVRVRQVETGIASRTKSLSERAREEVTTVSGLIELPLTAAQDLWARARLHAAVDDFTCEFAEGISAGQHGVTVAFGRQRAVLRDPDAHRAALIESWAKRVNAFTAAAQGKGTPLSIVDCQPPGDVSQRAFSLDEVALWLDVRCRLDARTGSASP